MARSFAILPVLLYFLPTIYCHGNHGEAEMTTTSKNNRLSIEGVDVEWSYDKNSDTLHFKVVGPTKGWLAFGFSYKKEDMKDFDIALGGVRKNETYLYDLYSTSKSKPPLDSQQNFNLTSATEIGGKTTLEFYRKRLTGDSKDHQFEVGRPVYFMVAFHPTEDATNGTTFSYHFEHRAHTTSTYDVLSTSAGFTHTASIGVIAGSLLVMSWLIN